MRADCQQRQAQDPSPSTHHIHMCEPLRKPTYTNEHKMKANQSRTLPAVISTDPTRSSPAIAASSIRIRSFPAMSIRCSPKRLETTTKRELRFAVCPPVSWRFRKASPPCIQYFLFSLEYKAVQFSANCQSQRTSHFQIETFCIGLFFACLMPIRVA